MKRRIYVVGRSVGYAKWMQGKLVRHMADADLVVLTGGEDINPDLYKEDAAKCYFNEFRDKREVEEYEEAKSRGKKIIGTCRGIQLICALNGGKLIQDIRHPHMHQISTFDGRRLITNSLHHQMCHPFNLPEGDYKILATAPMISPYHHDGYDIEMKTPAEVEGLYFPKTQSMGWQGHPEMMDESSSFVGYCRFILDKFMNDKLEGYYNHAVKVIAAEKKIK